MNVQTLFIVGLSVDIAGAYLVARGLLARPEDVRRQASTRVGSNPYVEFRLTEDKVDGRFGLVYLVLGFGVQILAYVLTVWSKASTDYGSGPALAGLAFAAGALLAAVLVYALLRELFVLRELGRITLYNVEGELVGERDTHTLQVYAAFRGYRGRHESEDTAEYLRETVGIDPSTGQVAPLKAIRRAARRLRHLGGTGHG